MKKGIAVLIAVLLLTTSFVFAEGGLTAVVSDIKLFLNGDRVDKEIVIIDGSSYLPVKAISEALELEVVWNGDTRAIELSANTENSSSDSVAEEMLELMTQNNKALEDENAKLKDLLTKNSIKIPTVDSNAVYVGDEQIKVLSSFMAINITDKDPLTDYLGNEYTKGLRLAWNSGYGGLGSYEVALQGQYDKFITTVYCNNQDSPVDLIFTADDVVVLKINVKPNSSPQDIELDTKGVKILTLTRNSNVELILDNARFIN